MGLFVTTPGVTTVATTTLAPAASVQLPAVAMPLALVTAEVVPIVPMPPMVAKFTVTPATGSPRSSTTVSAGATPVVAPGAATWPLGVVGMARVATPTCAARARSVKLPTCVPSKPRARRRYVPALSVTATREFVLVARMMSSFSAMSASVLKS
ncbi:MAG: hypothetical protein IPJ78_12575 [Gemmatimonadetes bacterium]|nr:hypothetical protein [Gemmatimonadota bacterium]